MTSPSRITTIQARYQAATPGKWTAGYVFRCRAVPKSSCAGDCGATQDAIGVATHPSLHEHHAVIVCETGPIGDEHETASRADAEFIANAPADIAYLLGEVERLQKDVDRLTAAASRVMLRVPELRAGLDRQAFGWEPPTTDAGEALNALREAAGISVFQSDLSPYGITILPLARAVEAVAPKPLNTADYFVGCAAPLQEREETP